MTGSICDTKNESICVPTPIDLADLSCVFSLDLRAQFEHAAHVTMATDKFLKRIAAPDIEVEEEQNDMAEDIAKMLSKPNDAAKAVVLSEIINRKYI